MLIAIAKVLSAENIAFKFVVSLRLLPLPIDIFPDGDRQPFCRE